ncbi:MAG: hypothetical protein M3248_02985 [Actinomycetota bacterium]|nr:hypothetical protein [Actinomycetota bacterium]
MSRVFIFNRFTFNPQDCSTRPRFTTLNTHVEGSYMVISEGFNPNSVSHASIVSIAPRQRSLPPLCFLDGVAAGQSY